jgi:citrate lyase subunit beta / citryl-CoA lyase
MTPTPVRRSATHARALGFGAKLGLHPRQTDAVNEAFGYDQRQRSWAHRLALARRILASTAT